MTTNEIAKIILKDLSAKSFPIFLTTFSGRGIHEADVFGINNNGYMYEFEIKRSRSDFYSDFKNKDSKHRNLRNREAIHNYDEWKNGKKTGETTQYIIIPNRFYFVCKEGLLNVSDMPEYAGLKWIDVNGDLHEVKNAPLLHKNKANAGIYQRAAIILCNRSLYGCSFMTYQNRLNYEELLLSSQSGKEGEG